MRLRRSLLLAATAATLCSGCTTFNDRFYVPGRDPLKEFLGDDYETDAQAVARRVAPRAPADAHAIDPRPRSAAWRRADRLAAAVAARSQSRRSRCRRIERRRSIRRRRMTC